MRLLNVLCKYIYIVETQLHCALAAAQCIVIGPVCVFTAGGWRVFVDLLPR